MNIFILDHDITRCARAHCDQHVSKMVLESVQLLCTAAQQHGLPAPYRPTHAHHPCVHWVAESFGNFIWLRELTLALNREYRWRFGRSEDHASIAAMRELSATRYDDNGLTPFAQAMPEQYKVVGDAVTAYRNFYVAEKARFARWSRRRPPAWYMAGIAQASGHRRSGVVSA